MPCTENVAGPFKYPARHKILCNKTSLEFKADFSVILRG